MKDEVWRKILNYCAENDFETPLTPPEIYRFLSSFPMVTREELGSKRHWDDVYRVIRIYGMLIGFQSAETTGDDSPEDKGWVFDLNSIEELESYTETITVTKYRPKN